MGAAFQVYNDAGRLQLDAVAPVMSLIANLGSGTVGPYPDTNYPRLLVRLPNADGVGPGSEGTTNLLFGRPSVVPAAGEACLALYDAAGRMTYSSAQLPLRVAGFMGGTQGESFEGVPGQVYGVVFPCPLSGDGWRQTNTILVGGEYQYTDEEWYEHYLWRNVVSAIEPHSLQVIRLVTGWDGYGTRRTPLPDNDFGATLLVADVTNY